MKIVRRIVVPLLGSALLCTGVQAENLQEIYQQALQNDHQFKSAHATYLAGKEDKNLGRSGLLPQISGQAYWQDGSTDRSGTSGSGAQLPSSVDSKSNGYSISLQQPLFDLNAWHRYQSGKANASLAEAQYEADKQNLIVRSAQAYFNALLAVKALETAMAQENALEHQLEQTKQRFEVGLTAITDVDEAQAVYDSSVADRLLAQGKLGIAFEALQVITGQPTGSLAPLKDEFPVVLPQPAERSDWEKRAIDSNYNLIVARDRADAAEQQAKASRADHFPTVVASANYSKTNDDTQYKKPVSLEDNIDTDGNSIRVTLSVPLFAGGAITASASQATQRSIAAREDYLQARADTIQNVRSLYLSVETGVATVKARKQAITSSESALEATRAGYEVGTRDLVDVLNAQKNVFLAKSNYYDALYSYILNSLQLKSSAGYLADASVGELNQWLDVDKPVYRDMRNMKTDK